MATHTGRPVYLTGLTHVQPTQSGEATGGAKWDTLVLEFRDADASAGCHLGGGRKLYAILAPAEVAEILLAAAALFIADDEDAAAVFRAARSLGQAGIPA